MLTFTTVIRPRYADTDQMKFVYYGKYFEYFEQGRSELLRSIGLPYNEIESHGILIPVIEAHAEYKRPARYDEPIEILTTMAETPVARIRIEYRVTDQASGELIATGYTAHGFLNAATNKPTRAPAFFVQSVEEAMLASRG
jgi:acyl-CoA thioester hydrolase